MRFPNSSPFLTSLMRLAPLMLQVSIVRSISMDSWSHSEILSMLEGGNKQLNDFFQRHDLPASHDTESDYIDACAFTYPICISPEQGARNRYKTNAAEFYRNNLAQHVMRIQEKGMYNGRESFRKEKRNSLRKGKKRTGGNGRGEETRARTFAVECGGQSPETNTTGDAYR